ncbi:MAG TPA: YjbQ family protein [Thermoplasmatales archaeon]|nr:YjbQ family protein [Thermoplasmatales archaeon]
MIVYSQEITISTSGEGDIIDVTADVNEVVKKSGVKNGIACVFVPGSTGALTTIEYEPGLKKDLPETLERLIPKNIYYHHHEMWHDGNGHSHVRASIIGPSLTIPIKNSKIVHGTWQQIVFIEMDIRKRERKIFVQIMGE